MEKGYLSQKLLNGASLSSVMVPNPELPSNFPAHDESYRFRYIYFEGDRFIAQTASNHRSLRDGQNHTLLNAFSYSVGYKQEMIVSSHQGQNAVFGHIPVRYKEFNWIVREDFTEVWNSKKNKDTTALHEAIISSLDMKLALKDEDGLWSVMPIDLANIEQVSKQFSVRTENAFSPSVIPDKPGLHNIINQVQENRRYPEEFIHVPNTIIPIYYACFSDGTYYNYFDEIRDVKRPYEELRIFVRKNESCKSEIIPYELANRPFDE